MHWRYKQNIILCTGLAVILHVCLVWLCSLHRHTTPIAGNTHTNLLHSYLFPWQQLQRPVYGNHRHTVRASNQLNRANYISATKKQAISAMNRHIKLIKHHQIEKNTHAVTANLTAGNGRLQEQGDAALLAIIHNQIQQYHVYPPLAAARQQTGTVWLTFQLQPAGNIQHIRILQTSKNKVLDHAAEQTLVAASPLSLPPGKVRSPMWFTIHLVYSS